MFISLWNYTIVMALSFAVFVAEVELSPVRCQVSEVTSAVCGGEFTVWLTSADGSSIMYGFWTWFNIVLLTMSS